MVDDILMKLTKKQIDTIQNQCLSYYDELYRVCLTRVNYNKDIASNCVQDTYLALTEALNSEDCKIEKYQNWMYKVLYTKMKLYYKEKVTYNQTILDIENEGVKKQIETIVDESADTAAEIENLERKRLLLEKASCLKERERYLLIEIYYNNRKLTEIAQIRHESTDSIKKQHQRLKKKLFKLLEHS